MKLMMAAMAITMAGAIITAQAMTSSAHTISLRSSSEVLLAELQEERRQLGQELRRSVTTTHSAPPAEQPAAEASAPRDIREFVPQPRRIAPTPSSGFKYDPAPNPDLNPRVSL